MKKVDPSYTSSNIQTDLGTEVCLFFQLFNPRENVDPTVDEMDCNGSGRAKTELYKIDKMKMVRRASNDGIRATLVDREGVVVKS